jgi:hypothetical protein
VNITLTGKKISLDERILAFKKDNLTAQMTFTVDTDDSWAYKLDVRLPVKCCTGEELFNIIDLPMDASRTCTIDVTAAMVPFTGKYTMQLRGISGEQVYHSDTFEIWVKYSIDPGAVYDPVPSEFYQIEDNITEINNNPPKPGENGYWLIWDVTTHQYKESAIPLPDGTLPGINVDTSGKYLSNDGKKAYWAEVQTGTESKIDKIEVNGVEQPIVDKTVNISVPTKTSDLSNDSGYITNEALDDYATKAELPTKVSQLENDSKFINKSALDGYAKTADIPTKTSQLNNDSGYITANDVPVKSVDGATGDVVTNAVKTTAQTLTDAQKQQARTNIGAGTSSFDGDYNSLTNKPTIPTKTSELDNDSGFITEANIPVKSVNGKTGDVTLDAKAVGALPDSTVIPSKTSELDNDSGYITNAALDGYAKTTDIPTKVGQLDNDAGYVNAEQAKNAAPVQSVNGQTGVVVIDIPEAYELPIASSTQLGGVKPDDKTAEQTVPVGVDKAGKLWVKAATEIDTILAEKVMFDSNMVFTEQFGKYKPSGGKVTIPSEGKSLKGLLLDAYSEDKNPVIAQPSVGISSSTARAYEVGTVVTPAYSGSFNVGKYEYGPTPTGVSVTEWQATNNVTTETKATQTGSFAQYIVPDGSNYRITIKATYSDGANPVTALGAQYEAGKINGGSKTAQSGAITGYRNSFYGTLADKSVDVDNTVVRALQQKSGRSLVNGNTFTVNIPVGAEAVLILYPATLRDVTSIKDVNGLNADITSAFTKSEMSVTGANNYTAINYKMYRLDYAKPNDTANKYTVTI